MFSWLTPKPTNATSHVRSKTSKTYTIERFAVVHDNLRRFGTRPAQQVVENLRQLSEFLIYSDQNLETNSFFDFFCEKNILALFVEIAHNAAAVFSKKFDRQNQCMILTQLYQTLSLLIQNITSTTSLYYLLSNNHINSLIELSLPQPNERRAANSVSSPSSCSSNTEQRGELLMVEEIRDWYVTFLKALSIRLNANTVQFFFNAHLNVFPLYTEALPFITCEESMIRIAVRTITLNIYHIQDEHLRRYITKNSESVAFFEKLADLCCSYSLDFQASLDVEGSCEKAKIVDKMDSLIDHFYYIQDILDIDIPELSYTLSELLFERFFQQFLLKSLLPFSHTNHHRVSCMSALYILSHMYDIFSHTPLLNAMSNVLIQPMGCSKVAYATASLGADGNDNKACADRDRQREDTKDELLNDMHGTSKVADFLSCIDRKNDAAAFRRTKQTFGEWEDSEVQVFVDKLRALDDGSCTNIFRQTMLQLIQSRNERLSYNCMLLLYAIMNNEHVDGSLLKEAGISPNLKFRARRLLYKLTVSPRNGEKSLLFTNEDQGSDQQESSDDDDEDDRHQNSSVFQYDTVLLHSFLSVFEHMPVFRSCTLELAIHVVLDLVVDDRPHAPYLSTTHRTQLGEIHAGIASNTIAYCVEANFPSDLFLDFFEDELYSMPALHQRLANRNGFGDLSNITHVLKPSKRARSKSATPLSVRQPLNDMETCKKIITTFLLLRELRIKIEGSHDEDEIDRYERDLVEQWTTKTFENISQPSLDVLPEGMMEDMGRTLSTSRITTSSPTPSILSPLSPLPCTLHSFRANKPVRSKLVYHFDSTHFILVDSSSNSQPQIIISAPLHHVNCVCHEYDASIVYVSIRAYESVDGASKGALQRSNSSFMMYSIVSPTGRNTFSTEKFHASLSTQAQLWSLTICFRVRNDGVRVRNYICKRREDIRKAKMAGIENSVRKQMKDTQEMNALCSLNKE